MEKVPLTRTGAVRLEAEMKKLKSVERPTIIRAIAEARELGDLKRMPNITLRAKSRDSLRAESKSWNLFWVALT